MSAETLSDDALVDGERDDETVNLEGNNDNSNHASLSPSSSLGDGDGDGGKEKEGDEQPITPKVIRVKFLPLSLYSVL